MATTFHYAMMQTLDAHRMAGKSYTAAHRVLREALRQKNMKGAQFRTAKELVGYCYRVLKSNAKPQAVREVIRPALKAA